MERNSIFSQITVILLVYIACFVIQICRFQRPLCLWCGSTTTRSYCGFESHGVARMSVSCECCVVSGRGLYVELITRPEECYRIWCVWVWMRNLYRKPWFSRTVQPRGKKPPISFLKKKVFISIKTKFLKARMKRWNMTCRQVSLIVKSAS